MNFFWEQIKDVSVLAEEYFYARNLVNQTMRAIQQTMTKSGHLEKIKRSIEV